MREQDYGFGKRHTKPGERWFDKRRIDVREPGEIDFWSKFFGVNGVQLLCAIDKVGTSALQVRKFLEQQNPRLH